VKGRTSKLETTWPQDFTHAARKKKHRKRVRAHKLNRTIRVMNANKTI